MNVHLKSTAAAVAVAIGLAAPANAAELVFAHGANAGNPRYDAANMFAGLVSSCTGGELTVNVAPSATMGNDAEMITSVQSGVIEMSANSQGAMGQVVPEVGMLGLPFLFSSLNDAWEALDGEAGALIDQKAQAAGMKVVGYWDNGIRNVTHTSKHIASPDDIKGMKIRTPPDEVTLAMFNALGANPAPLAWSELPSALRSGAFEGQENPLTNIHSAKLHEITPFISMTGHKYETTPVVAGLGWWNGLPDAHRDCISNAVTQAGWYQRGRSQLDNQALRAKMETEGAKFLDVDQSVFAEATASVYDLYSDKYGDIVNLLRGN
ncbi:TRAP transporter substrate-binding protein [Hoeflea poritis]|uniref:TRAP transporter substrate-binding protein n=1 Tax=Hoeflea poritis TaxID=2993659 RepID=A0ABT4VLY1_9HYPH|nr:TRAP transporter substrate-binding protein [Hoeflea poritis]MDA4845048.1 TRAP transporter substrate-binding protein [Hoeflea poritis]